MLDDADPKKVAPGIFDGAFQNTGQVCLAIKRLYVMKTSMTRSATSWSRSPGAPSSTTARTGTKLGPLQNKMQYEKVKGFLEDAHKNGNIVAGGSAWIGPVISSSRPSCATSRKASGWSTKNSSDRSCR